MKQLIFAIYLFSFFSHVEAQTIVKKSSGWKTIMDNARELVLSGNRIGVITTDNVAWVKEGTLNANWVREMDNAKELVLSGNRIGVITTDNLAWVKEGALSANWVREMDNSKQLVLSGNRIGVITTDNVAWVKEGALSSNWVREMDNAKELVLSGNRIGVITTDNVAWVKEGALSANWVREMDNSKELVLSGNRIGVITTDNVAWVKEGALSANWVREMDNSKQLVLSGNRIGVITTDNTAYVKEGILTADWLYQNKRIDKMSLTKHRERIGILTQLKKARVKEVILHKLPPETNPTSIETSSSTTTGSAFKSYNYWSKKCSYDVYVAKKTGLVQCNDWSYQGKVTPSNKIKITAYEGEYVSIRVVYNNGKVCNQSDQKLNTWISISKGAKNSENTNYELAEIGNCK